MRTYLISAVIAGVLSGFGFAQAAETVEGTVKSIDLDAGTIQLSNDITYTLPGDFSGPDLEIGDKVTVIWNHQDDVPLIESVTVSE